MHDQASMLFHDACMAPVQGLGAPVWGPHEYSNLEYRGSLPNVSKLKALRRQVWDLGQQQLKDVHESNEAWPDHSARKGDYYPLSEEEDQYKGVGENSVARFEMIKLMLDQFFIRHGRFAVLHLAFCHTWRYHQQTPYDKCFKWTDGDRLATRKTGFIFLNEQHLINIRCDGNKILLCETDMSDTDTNRDLAVFLKHRQVFPTGTVIEIDENTPEGWKGGCNTLAMVNATLSHNEYASVEEANEMKIPLVEAIYKKMRTTNKTPRSLAGYQWRHWKLGINAPWSCSREVVSHSHPSLGLVEYGSRWDDNEEHRAIMEAFHNADLSTYGYEDPPDKEYDRESDEFKAWQVGYDIEAEEIKEQLDDQARVEQPMADWVKAYRDAVAQYGAERWDTVPYRPVPAYMAHEPFEDPNDHDAYDHDGTYTPAEIEAWKNRGDNDKYTPYFPKVPWK